MDGRAFNPAHALGRRNVLRALAACLADFWLCSRPGLNGLKHCNTDFNNTLRQRGTPGARTCSRPRSPAACVCSAPRFKKPDRRSFVVHVGHLVLGKAGVPLSEDTAPAQRCVAPAATWLAVHGVSCTPKSAPGVSVVRGASARVDVSTSGCSAGYRAASAAPRCALTWMRDVQTSRGSCRRNRLSPPGCSAESTNPMSLRPKKRVARQQQELRPVGVQPASAEVVRRNHVARSGPRRRRVTAKHRRTSAAGTTRDAAASRLSAASRA